jgi:hypothetical protein
MCRDITPDLLPILRSTWIHRRIQITCIELYSWRCCVHGELPPGLGITHCSSQGGPAQRARNKKLKKTPKKFKKTPKNTCPIIGTHRQHIAYMQCKSSVHKGITETNRIQLVLFVMQNRTLGHCLAAIHRIHEGTTAHSAASTSLGRLRTKLWS